MRQLALIALNVAETLFVVLLAACAMLAILVVGTLQRLAEYARAEALVLRDAVDLPLELLLDELKEIWRP